MKSENTSIDLLAWAATMEVGVLAGGRSLAHWQAADARQVGVRFPDRVRVLLVDAIPAPGDPDLLAAARRSGVFDGDDGHLTLGYAIMIHRRCLGSRRILRRALGAVAEFELAGSLHSFLTAHPDPMPGVDRREERARGAAAPVLVAHHQG